MRKTLKAIFNTVTKPAVMATTANAAVASLTSTYLMWSQLGFAVGCGALAALQEYRKAGGKVTLPKLLETFMNNPGATMIVLGLASAVATTASAIQNGLTTFGDVKYHGTLALFSVGNVVSGSDWLTKYLGRIAKDPTLFFVAGSFLMAGPGMWYGGPFMLAALALNLKNAISGKESGRLLARPIAYLGTGYIAMGAALAFLFKDPFLGAVTAYMGLGSFSIDATRRHGGTAEAIGSLFKKRELKAA